MAGNREITKKVRKSEKVLKMASNPRKSANRGPKALDLPALIAGSQSHLGCARILGIPGQSDWK